VGTDFETALVAEIETLQRQLEVDPRYIKLRELQRVQGLYAQPQVISPPPRVRPVTTGGRSASPERQAILKNAKLLLQGRTEPTSTSDIYDMLVVLSVDIPGTNPKNNLSAMLSNSDDFVTHGRAGWTLKQETPEASDDLISRSASEASNSASPADPPAVRPVDPVPGGGG